MATDPTPTPDPKPTDPGERLDPTRLIAENGSAEAAVRMLAFKLNDVERDNYTLRQRERDLLKKLPADDALVLAGDRKAAFDAMSKQLEEAGLDSAENLRAFVEAKRAAEAEVERFEHRDQLDAFVSGAGANREALEAAKGSEALTYIVEGEGDDARYLVQPPAEDGETPPAPVAFAEYVEKTWPALAPSILGEAEREARREATSTPETPGTPFIMQRPGGRPPNREKTAEQIADEKRRSPEYAGVF